MIKIYAPQEQTSRDLRTNEPLLHRHGSDYFNVNIAGWKGDAERVYQCAECNKFLSRADQRGVRRRRLKMKKIWTALIILAAGQSLVSAQTSQGNKRTQGRCPELFPRLFQCTVSRLLWSEDLTEMIRRRAQKDDCREKPFKYIR